MSESKIIYAYVFGGVPDCAEYIVYAKSQREAEIEMEKDFEGIEVELLRRDRF